MTSFRWNANIDSTFSVVLSTNLTALRYSKLINNTIENNTVIKANTYVLRLTTAISSNLSSVKI